MIENFLQALEPHLTYRTVESGTTLLYQSEIPRHAIIITKGIVRAYTITSSGDERIVALYTKGDILPLSWVFGETKTTLFYYEANADCELALVPKTAFLSAVQSSPELSQALLHYTIKEQTAQQMRITALEQSNASDKIALTMYYLLLRHGRQHQPGIYSIEVKLTQSAIAALVGITRESTAVNITKLKKRGVLTYQNFIYTIDKKKLEDFLGEDSFKDLSLK